MRNGVKRCEECMLKLYGEEGKRETVRVYGKERCTVGLIFMETLVRKWYNIREVK